MPAIDTAANLGGAEAFRLRDAILVYGDGQRGFATRHEPMQGPDGRSTILGPGQLVSTAFVKALANDLGASVPVEVLAPEVLVRTAEVTVWWRPATKAPMFFNLAKGDANRAPLAKISGRSVAHPPLVFMATPDGLWVRALRESQRPVATTEVFAAPYYNVAQDGRVCVGSMRAPHGRGMDSLAQWERAFFESEFTHPLTGAKLTAFPKGFVGLWTMLAGSGKTKGPAHFPVNTLARLGKKGQRLSDFLASSRRAR